MNLNQSSTIREARFHLLNGSEVHRFCDPSVSSHSDSFEWLRCDCLLF